MECDPAANHRSRLRLRGAGLGLALLAGVATTASAADARWPARPLHIIAAQSPGGPRT